MTFRSERFLHVGIDDRGDHGTRLAFIPEIIEGIGIAVEALEGTGVVGGGIEAAAPYLCERSLRTFPVAIDTTTPGLPLLPCRHPRAY